MCIIFNTLGGRIKVIGIVGRIGAGKTTVANIISELKENTLAIDVDKVAKNIYKMDENVLKEIKSSFGDDVFDGGNLVFRRLGQKVFSDSSELKKLNRIMFPLIRNEVKNMIDSSHDKNLIVIDAAVLFDCKLDLLCDYIIQVKAEKRKRKKLLIKKGLPEGEANLKLKGQKIKINKKLVDFLIVNNSNLENLKIKVKETLGQIE